MSVDLTTQHLFEAIVAGNYSQVKFAIDSGAAVNDPNDHGQTPLVVACAQGNLKIVDLLIAAGAQMNSANAAISSKSIDKMGILPLSEAEDWKSIGGLDREVNESPVSREIAYEDLIDLIHQPSQNNPTEIEELVSITSKSAHNHDPGISTPTPGQHLHQMAANWQDIESDPEATYTFDLDEVFAAHEASLPLATSADLGEMFVENEVMMTSLDRSANPSEWEANETYAFDLSPDLDRLTSTPEEPDQLSMPMGEWEEGETYAIDLDNFCQPLTDLDLTSPSADRLVLNESSRFANTDFDEGETYVVDLDQDHFAEADFEGGETYAIDLDDLDDINPSHLIGGVVATVQPTSHLLPDLDATLLPIIGGEDHDAGSAFDLDTEVSTDIHGHSGSKPSSTADQPGYDENATNTSLMAAIIAGDIDLAQQAVEAGAALDRYDWELGYCPLGMAIDRGHGDIVQMLLNVGVNPHGGSTLMTALGLAAERGEAEMIQLLLPRGVDVNQPVAADGWTALLSAIKHGHRSIVQLLVTAGANVNVWSQGETPILLAAKCEEQDIYQYLYPLVNIAIRLCADRDGEQLLQSTRKRRIREQNRPVEKFIAMATAGNAHEVSRAIEIGIEIDAIGAQGHTALMVAAYYGHQSIVQILLAAGAEPNLLSDGHNGLGMGMTALMLAAGSFFASDRQTVAKLLIAGGADVDRQSASGKTAIMYAASAGSGYRDCVEMLIATGANLDLRDDRGHTVLTSVATAENYPMFNLLLQAGASTEGLESIQLIQAARIGNLDRVQSLLSARVNLDLDRGAAISNAAAAGHTQIVDLLIRAGANVNLSNDSGFTPLASAAYAGYGTIVQLLIDAGADIQAPAGLSHSYSALEYAQMGLYQFIGTTANSDGHDDRQHAQIVRQLEQLGAG